MIIVTVSQSNCFHPPTINRFDNRGGIVCCIDHNDFAIVADQPNIVGDFPFATIKRETNSWKYTGYAVVYLFGLAYLFAFLVYQTASALA